MAANKKIDEKDLVFINQHWPEEEKKSFSDFLKIRKKKSVSPKDTQDVPPDKTLAPGELDHQAS